ncbi:MAG: ABC-F type ribosomal protection protein [Clostridia bacterium]|nr:ABC-F type ribosomal protection protein [Clostridia bacterium]
MLLLHARNVKKSFGDRTIVDFEELKIYDQDRVGIVGLNGSGKTTLMEILSEGMEPEEGTVSLFADVSYIKQFGEGTGSPDAHFEKEFGVKELFKAGMSGGERTRLKIASELSRNSRLLFADEPTTNLDLQGIKLVEEKLIQHQGALLIISHDRELLDRVCTSIVEISDGKLSMYKGNYSQYKLVKEQQKEREFFEFNQYISEKRRLEERLTERNMNIQRVRKAPKRMGNSEARLHKRESTEIQQKLARRVSAIESRIQRLEVKEKPKNDPKIIMEAGLVETPVSRTIASGRKINLSYGKRVLFDSLEFEIPSGSKTALIGSNGSGKTTLIKMLIQRDDRIRLANGVKIGYFSQELDILKPDKTVLENVMGVSIRKEWAARTVLARLFFKGDEVYKKVGILSGGEKVKLTLAMLLLSDANFLVMDEPTNYLDLLSMEALQGLLQEYAGTVLFVSHDRRFVSEIADRVLVLQDRKLTVFEDGYEEYLAFLNKKDKKPAEPPQNEMILKMRLAELAAKLATPKKCSNYEELDREYNEIVAKLKQLTFQ